MHCHKYHSSSFQTHDEWEWWHQSIYNSKKKFYKHTMHAWRSKIGISIIYIQIESYNIDIINTQFPMKLSLLVLPIMLVTLNLNRYLTLKFWCFFWLLVEDVTSLRKFSVNRYTNICNSIVNTNNWQAKR
jgi:hypothetical protein